MADVAEWLTEQGLAKYVETFIENEIDFDVLADLDNNDLERLGLPMGPRKRLLRAIADLNSDTSLQPLAAPETATASKSDEAERRQLTVMFCDLVGSTELSEKLDPEDLRDVLREYQSTCADAVARLDGHIAKYIGDGLLIYFGYPQAHEDDARRAVKAGLGVVEGVKDLNQRLGERHGIELGVRVGIHTGLVVAGEMGSGKTLEADAIVGQTPNIAARLEGLAQPNTVAISAATHHLVEGLFSCDALGPQPLRGISEPAPVFRVRSESGALSHFEAAARRGLTNLVGRESEIELLLNRWGHAKEDELQVVLLSGEAGIGKSRIVRAVREALDTEDHIRMVFYCSPYHQNSALHPVIERLERAIRLETSDGTEQKLEKLLAFLRGLSLPENELTPLLAPLLSLSVEGRYPAQEMSPQLRRRRTLEALLSIIEATAAQKPVLVVVEDAHWVDPSTLEMLGLLIERLRSARVLLLVNSRPEFEPPWTGHANLTALRLNRLTRKESVALSTGVADGRTLPDEILEQIVERTDGIPLFVEELTKTVLESDLLAEEADGYALRGPLRPLAIPASLHDSLMARLDRLESAKEVAQLAATIGRSFSREVLAAVSPLDKREMEDALSELEAAELVYRRSVAPEIIYEFKHALVRDAAYQSLLKSNRQRHHEHIARILEEKFQENTDSELLAHHYTEAGLAGPAIDHWQNAGKGAMQRSAHIEAEGHLRKGLAVLQSMPEGSERRRREIALQNSLGVCLMPARGFGDPEVAAVFSRAASLAETEGDSNGLFVALRGKGQYQMTSGDLYSAREQASRILSLAEESDDPDIVIEAHHLGWSSLSFTGEFEAARKHAETGIALYDRDRHHRLTYIYSGHDPGVCCRTFGSLAKWQLGYPDQALAQCQNGVALAESLSHPFSLTVALWAKGMLHMLRRETSGLRQTGELMLAHCSDKGIPPFIPMGKIYRGGARAAEGEFAEGIAEMREGIAGVRATGTQYTLPLFYAWLGEMCLKNKEIIAGLAAIEDGLAMAEKTHDRFVPSEFLRLKAELLIAGPEKATAEAEACLEQALEIACNQGAKLLELRTATSLARLWGETNRRAEAQELLATLYAWFSEGADTPDLVDARTLLDELS